MKCLKEAGSIGKVSEPAEALESEAGAAARGAGKAFSEEKQALVAMAKGDKRADV